MSGDPSLALFLGALLPCGAAIGAYIGIVRARAPFGAPEPQETIDRRRSFKQAHLGQARFAVIVTGCLLVAAGRI